MMRAAGKPVVLGWCEWVSLPTLGVHVLKAKIDTGARTSALHTFTQELYTVNGRDRVRFGLHPYRKTTTLEVFCEADVYDRRVVRDSGGHDEERIVIRSVLRIGESIREVDITLTNRENMQFRMLVGRTALNGFIVNPRAQRQMGTRRELLKIYRKGE